MAFWPLLLLASLVTCKVWSLDLYLKKLPVYILLTEFNKAPLFHQSLGPRVFLSFFLSPSLSFFLSVYFWLIPWRANASCLTQGTLASFLLSLSHRQLRTTRFLPLKGCNRGERQDMCLGLDIQLDVPGRKSVK